MAQASTKVDAPPKTCAAYVRISRDAAGERLGVQRQREDTQALAERLGLTVVEVYEDNDITASKGKYRENFERMLKDGRAGRFGVIIAYTSQRLSREPFEKEMLIRYARTTGIRLQYVASPSFDLETADGRTGARFQHVVDVGGSEKIGELVSREARQRAEMRRFNGGQVPWGYRGVPYVTEDKKGHSVIRLNIEVDPDTSKLVQEAVRRVLAGTSLYSVAAAWNAAGVTTRRGNRWRGSTIRNVLTTPAIAGVRILDGKEYPAPWPAIVSRQVWEDLCQRLNDQERVGYVPSTGAYVGKRPWNGLIRCREGHVMVSHYTTKAKVLRLTCHTCPAGGKVSVRYAPLNDWLMSLVWHLVDTPEFRQALAARSTTSDQDRRVLRDELAALDQRRQRVLRSFDLGIRTEAEMLAEVKEIGRLRNEIVEKLASMTSTYVLETVPSPDVYETCDVTQQHAFLSELIECVVIHPVGQGGNVSRRKGESDEALAERKRERDLILLRQRAEIRWRM